MTNITICVEYDEETGIGHLRRMQTLAEELKQLGAQIDWAVLGNKSGLDFLKVKRFDSAEVLPANIVIVDGNGFDLSKLRRNVSNLLCVIDDLGKREIDADIVINPNIYGHEIAYPKAQHVLGGIDYSLISPTFENVSKHPVKSDATILVTFGGAHRLVGLGVQIVKQLEQDWGQSAILALPQTTALNTDLMDIEVRAGEKLDTLLLETGPVICGLGTSFIEVLSANRPVFGVCVASDQKKAFETAKKFGYSVTNNISPANIVEKALRSFQNPVPPRITMIRKSAQRAASELINLRTAL